VFVDPGAVCSQADDDEDSVSAGHGRSGNNSCYPACEGSVDGHFFKFLKVLI